MAEDSFSHRMSKNCETSEEVIGKIHEAIKHLEHANSSLMSTEEKQKCVLLFSKEGTDISSIQQMKQRLESITEKVFEKLLNHLTAHSARDSGFCGSVTSMQEVMAKEPEGMSERVPDNVFSPFVSPLGSLHLNGTNNDGTEA